MSYAARVQPSVCERMIGEGVYREAWTGGTVRLIGSDLVGGTPAVHITGFAFHPSDVERLAHQQRPTPQLKPKMRKADAQIDGPAPPAPEPKRAKRAVDLSRLHSGALLLTVKETEAALAISHTTVYKLINAGKLERPEGETRVTAESVRRYAGNLGRTPD